MPSFEPDDSGLVGNQFDQIFLISLELFERVQALLSAG